jgi:MEMO1 family protein
MLSRGLRGFAYHGQVRETIRRTSVAGTWYPRSASRLATEVDEHLARAEIGADLPRPLAIVAPHAGLAYSGPVAACAYALVGRHRFDAVVLVGPSHFVPFEGVSIWPTGAWDTPFGPVPVDDALARAIREASPLVIEVPEAHGREHALEMQLPFVARVAPGVPIVPLAMGAQARSTAFALAGALVAGLRGTGAAALLVASSDLSHYEDAATAARLDAVVLDRVSKVDAEGLMRALEAEPRHACGGGPMVAVIEAARRLGASRARLLRYADSGDVSGDKSAVVGYMAAALW